MMKLAGDSLYNIRSPFFGEGSGKVISQLFFDVTIFYMESPSNSSDEEKN